MLFPLFFHVSIYWLTSFCIISSRKDKSFSSYIPDKFVLFTVLFNQLVVTPLTCSLYTFDSRPNGNKLPSIISLSIFIFIHAYYFFCVHVLMHTRFLFKYVHCIHHMFPRCLPYHALFCSPFEHAVLNVTSFMIGPVLFGSDLVTFYVWILIATVSTCNAHAGALRASMKTHDLHHLIGTINFSSGLNFMDKLHGSFRGVNEKSD